MLLLLVETAAAVSQLRGDDFDGGRLEPVQVPPGSLAHLFALAPEVTGH